MKHTLLILFFLIMNFNHAQSLNSPNGLLVVNFSLSDTGMPYYNVYFKGDEVIGNSALGFSLKHIPNFSEGFVLVGHSQREIDAQWSPVLGEYSTIRDHANEVKFTLRHTPTEVMLDVIFRVYDAGVAFRYDFVAQEKLNYFIIQDELTQFNLKKDFTAHWIPGDYDSQEYNYNKTLLSQVDNTKLFLDNGIGFKGPMGINRVQTPLQLQDDRKLYINIAEAALVNYPVMHLDIDKGSFVLSSHLVPNALGDKAYLQAPFQTPWRVLHISDQAKDIISSTLVLNLNEPSVIEDTSWIKPMKYIGIWWEMHVGVSTWDYAGSQNAQNNSEEGKVPTGRHAATTQNAKRYIDFAAIHGFDGVLIEGWNEGWEDWFGNWKEEVFDFVTPYPDFDIEEVTSYAKQKGVKLIMHHETSASVANYERRFDRAYSLMKKYGYDAVKTGYVGRIIPRGEWHDGQTMVNHFNWVVERAADYKVMVNSHESHRPTGLHRTYPNYISAEAARGTEFNAWSNGNEPSHEAILPFTRLLGGPMDYTPGIFEGEMSYYGTGRTARVKTTLAKQLALYVTMYSPLQMAADLPENYERFLDAFQFIKDVPLDWDTTLVLYAEPAEYLTMVRKEKGKDNWYLGAITNEEAREQYVKLDFLTAGVTYEMVVYEDGKNADYRDNPKSYTIRTKKVTNKSGLKLKLAPGGGTAISIKAIK